MIHFTNPKPGGCAFLPPYGASSAGESVHGSPCEWLKLQVPSPRARQGGPLQVLTKSGQVFAFQTHLKLGRQFTSRFTGKMSSLKSEQHFFFKNWSPKFWCMLSFLEIFHSNTQQNGRSVTPKIPRPHSRMRRSTKWYLSKGGSPFLSCFAVKQHQGMGQNPVYSA